MEPIWKQRYFCLCSCFVVCRWHQMSPASHSQLWIGRGMLGFLQERSPGPCWVLCSKKFWDLNQSAFWLLERNFLFPSLINMYVWALMLIVQAPLWFVLGEAMWGREANSLAWKGSSFFGCWKLSQNGGNKGLCDNWSFQYIICDGERFAVMIEGSLSPGDLYCRRKVWGFHPKHQSPDLLKENYTKLQYRWGKSPTIMLLKDVVFPFLSHQAGVWSGCVL